MSKSMGSRAERTAASQAASSLRDIVTNSLALAATFIVALTLVNVILIWIAPPRTDPQRLFNGSGMLWLSAIPSFLYAARNERRIPFLPAVCIAYFFYYGLPVFTGSIYVKGFPYDRPSVTTATELALVGLLFLLIAFYTPIGAFVERIPKFRLHLDLIRMRWWLLGSAAVMLILTVQALYGETPISIAAIIATLARIPLLFLCGIYLLHLRGQEISFEQKTVAVLLFVALMTIALGRGTLAQNLIAVASFVFLYIMYRRRPPLLGLALAALVFIPFLGTKIEFRERTWHRPDMGILERVATFVEITHDRVSREGLNFADEALDTSKRRTSYLGTFSYVVEMTPMRVPYWSGDTYRHLAWTFIPRFIAPDKPTRGLGQDFGHRYRLLSRDDYQTSFNFAQLIEMYANFGPVGVWLGMFFVGLIYRALYAFINHTEGGDGPILVSACLFAMLLNIESDAAVFAGIPLGIVIFAAAFWGLNVLVFGRLSVEPTS